MQQVKVMIGNEIVGHAYGVIHKISVERLVLEFTSIDTKPWDKTSSLVVGGKTFKVRFSSWDQCTQEGGHLVFKNISFMVVD